MLKIRTKQYLPSIAYTLVFSGLVVGVIGMLVTVCQSTDGYEVVAMNWTNFGAFFATAFPGLATIFHLTFSEE